MRVSNMKSSNGNSVPNQFVITASSGSFWTENGNLPSGDAFQSYETVIAFRDFRGKVYLDRSKWDYSKTTSTYRNKFLGMDTSMIKKAIASGEIELVDLN